MTMAIFFRDLATQETDNSALLIFYALFAVDANIKNPRPNDIIGFLNEHPSIQVIAMNGGKAKKDFIKMARPHYEFFKDYSLYGLASSSSLVKSAGWTLESLTDQWKIIANK